MSGFPEKAVRPLVLFILVFCLAPSCGFFTPVSDPSGDGALSDDPEGNLPDRGASLPWERYEAEDGTTTGTVLGPGRDVGTLEGEAAGRKAVRLTSGASVEWTLRKDANAVVIRASIPDSPSGGGEERTMSLYVDGVHRRDIVLSSKHSWLYGPESTQTDNPSDGTPRRIYDESHALVGTMRAGSSVKLQADPGDTAAYYGIDFLETENVPDPVEMPEGYVSVTDYGAAGDGRTDDTGAIRAAIAAAGPGGGVWLPEGTYLVNGKIAVSGRTVRGAGMWRTVFIASPSAGNQGDGGFGFTMSGDGSRFFDFSAFGNGTVRGNGGKFWSGGARNGTVIGRVWVEHVECAYWVAGGKNLRIYDSRFRNTFADTVNFCNGTTDSEIRNCTARNSGDDAFAIWSANDPWIPSGASRDNVIRHCTVENVWRAAAFAVYGGYSNTVEDCVALDTLVYPGITVSADFAPFFTFSGRTLFRNISLTRCGGKYWSGQQFGAVWIYAAQGANTGVRIESVDIDSPTYSGIHFQTSGGYTIGDLQISDVTVTNAGTNGILVKGGTKGSAGFRNVAVVGSMGSAFVNNAPSTFIVNRLGGNTGW